MANGKKFQDKNVCAANAYPLGALILVENTRNKKRVVVQVSDRISKKWAGTRVDLCREAFKQIADLKTGIIPVKIRRIR